MLVHFILPKLVHASPTLSVRYFLVYYRSKCTCYPSLPFSTCFAQATQVCAVNTISQTFHYDSNYGGRPSNETNAAWDSIFPAQGGFFKHPELAPQRSALAVFHQLHCLNGIRHGYFLARDAAATGQGLDDETELSMSSPLHIRHCIDLLRQSIMCQADTTVEIVDETAGGVTGFGTQHQCKNWDELIGWLGRWQAWGRVETHDDESGSNAHGGEHHHRKHMVTEPAFNDGGS